MTNEEIDIINSVKPVILRSVWLNKSIDCRDVIQDLFVKILNNYEKFGELPNDEEKKNYAFRACKNILIDMHRSREVSRKKGKTITLCMDSYALKSTENIAKEVEIKEETNQVLETLKTYRHNHELMLTLHGFRAREIASHKNISINTVLGRVRYARNFLNENLHGTEN